VKEGARGRAVLEIAASLAQTSLANFRSLEEILKKTLSYVLVFKHNVPLLFVRKRSLHYPFVLPVFGEVINEEFAEFRVLFGVLESVQNPGWFNISFGVSGGAWVGN